MTRKSFAILVLCAVALLPLPACSQGGGNCCGRCGGSGNPKSDAQPSRALEAVYVCPMHPEVRQGSPGKCPKCGMDLERRQ